MHKSIEQHDSSKNIKRKQKQKQNRGLFFFFINDNYNNNYYQHNIIDLIRGGLRLDSLSRGSVGAMVLNAELKTPNGVRAESPGESRGWRL